MHFLQRVFVFGQEHQLQNVAAGQISATSTDAVNGSQLFSIALQVSALWTDLASITSDQQRSRRRAEIPP
ncbi:hypothetical protein [Paraburkholderia fynbosensis]|uniref:hypothetical protein n=1 Tax=Paraburkholderia fynbosensis TaxID=1200993 RepID=UPI003CCD74A2